jgi:putative tryptophan/tyrosine transport system substrate-binding protein
MSHTKRREFIAGLGGVASSAAYPVASRALQPGKQPTIGYLGGVTAASNSAYTTAFLKRLQELSWVEGRNVAIEYRWPEGRMEAASEYLAEFVGLKVDAIFVSGNAYALAATLGTRSVLA